MLLSPFIIVAFPAFILPAKPVLVKEFAGKCGGIRSLQPTRDGGFLAAGDEGVVHYDTRGAVVEEVTGPFTEPWCTLEGADMDMYVSCYDTNKVYRREKPGATWEVWGSRAQLKYPRGLALTGEGHLLVGDIGLEAVVELGKDGSPVRTMELGKLGAGGRDPLYIAVNHLHGGDIITSDPSNHCLDIFTSGGAHRRTIGTPRQEGSGMGQFYYPRDLHVDGRGRVLVSDMWNNGVVIMSGAGTVEGELLSESDGLRHPRGVCVTSQGYLITGDNGGKIRIWKYDIYQIYPNNHIEHYLCL